MLSERSRSIAMAGRATLDRAVGLSLVLLSILVVFGCGASAQRSLLVLTAASAEDAMIEAAAGFAQQSAASQPLSVRTASASSNALAQQILAGAPAHLFLSANERWADEVIAAGLAVSSVPLLSNRLVVVVPEGNPAGIEGIADLAADRIERLALAAESVPAGIYAQDSLASLFLFDELEAQRRLVRGQDVRQVLAFVERGEVDAGIVYRTDAAVSTRVEVVEVVDLGLHDAIVYPLVLLSTDADARSLFEHLQSSEALEIFERHGFDRIHPLDLTRAGSLR